MILHIELNLNFQLGKQCVEVNAVKHFFWACVRKIKLNTRILNLLEEEKITLIFCLILTYAARLESGSSRFPGLSFLSRHPLMVASHIFCQFCVESLNAEPADGS